MGTDDAEEYKAMLEGVELGTEATRTGIIDNARKSGYIQLKKDVYTILPDGIYMIESLARLNINMDKFKTSEMGKALKKVFRGEYAVSDSVELAKSEISRYFYKNDQTPEEDSDIGFFGDVVGVCPMCGAEVKRSKYGYNCSAYKQGCKFGIWISMCGKTISLATAKTLLQTGRTPKMQGFTGKSGKQFDAVLKLENGKCVFEFE
jgi:DNA topoisomerase-3